MSDSNDSARQAVDPTTFDFDAYNRAVIEEFRSTGGRMDGEAPVLLLHHSGAKSGRQHISPLMYTRDGDDYVVIGSKGGAPAHPHWFLNLQANPDVTIEVGAETIPVTARVTQGDECARLYAAQAAVMTQFAGYALATTREIPVVVLRRR